MKNLVQSVMVRQLPDGVTGMVVGILREESEIQGEGGGGDEDGAGGVEYEVAMGITVEEQRRFLAGEEGGRGLGWRASETLLFDGTCVRFVGLTGAAHLNGRPGIVQSADLDTGRYVVAYVDAGEGDNGASSGSSGAIREVRVRFQNVVV